MANKGVSDGPIRLFMVDEYRNYSQSEPLYWGNYLHNPIRSTEALGAFKTFTNVLLTGILNLKDTKVKSLNVYCSAEKIWGDEIFRSA